MPRRAEAPGEELNLIPIMNLVTLLIPFLLMSAQFVAYAVIDTTLPPICGTPCSAGDEEPVTVHLSVGPSGYTLVASGPDLDAFRGDGVTIPCTTPGCEGPVTEAWDVPSLRAQLTRIKDRHPEHGHLILSAGGAVPYEALVLAMDASREDPGQGHTGGRACDGRCLFPDVTLAGSL